MASKKINGQGKSTAGVQPPTAPSPLVPSSTLYVPQYIVYAVKKRIGALTYPATWGMLRSVCGQKVLSYRVMEPYFWHFWPVERTHKWLRLITVGSFSQAFTAITGGLAGKLFSARASFFRFFCLFSFQNKTWDHHGSAQSCCIAGRDGATFHELNKNTN